MEIELKRRATLLTLSQTIDPAVEKSQELMIQNESIYE
jgi:hypothetical protein